MRRLPLLLSLLFPTLPAFAQRSHGYVFAAPGGQTHRLDLRGRDFSRTFATLHAGGGGEARIGNGFGAGGELGYLGPIESLENGVGVASVNGYFHLIQDRLTRFDPFVTAGYSMLFRRDAFHAFNFGAGFNYWLDNGLGFKVEFRDHTRSPGDTRIHYWGVRFGVNFR